MKYLGVLLVCLGIGRHGITLPGVGPEVSDVLNYMDLLLVIVGTKFTLEAKDSTRLVQQEVIQPRTVKQPRVVNQSRIVRSAKDMNSTW